MNTGCSTDGGYAEFVKASACSRPQDTGWRTVPEATLCADAVAALYRALTCASGVKPGDLAVVFEAGGPGLNAVQVAKAFGVRW